MQLCVCIVMKYRIHEIGREGGNIIDILNRIKKTDNGGTDDGRK